MHRRCEHWNLGIAGAALALAAAVAVLPGPAAAAGPQIAWSAREKPLSDQIEGLRGLPDEVRGRTTREIALAIRALPPSANKLRLALYLSELSTEGDFGHTALQAVASTLAAAVAESPVPWKDDPGPGGGESDDSKLPGYAYQELAQLQRYEDVAVSLPGDAHFSAALALLESADRQREHLDFTLEDVTGKTWRFGDLRGKVVLVNFWATWCPPCRKELPALEDLYRRLAAKGLVILGISDEEAAKVDPFVQHNRLSFPVLLDPGRKVNDRFLVHGIPKSFVYDRNGRLVAQAIDMRTPAQFRAMLARAGL
jgi:peroxiredoxin